MRFRLKFIRHGENHIGRICFQYGVPYHATEMEANRATYTRTKEKYKPRLQLLPHSAAAPSARWCAVRSHRTVHPASKRAKVVFRRLCTQFFVLEFQNLCMYASVYVNTHAIAWAATNHRSTFEYTRTHMRVTHLHAHKQAYAR
jgi:hypothetical protein